MSADDAFAAMFAEWFVILPGAEAAVEWNAARYTLGFWRMQQARGVWVNAQARDVARWLDGLVREAVEGRFDADAYRADLDDARAARLRTLMKEPDQAMKDAFVYSDNWLATHLFAMAPQSERETMRYARAILVHQRSGDIDKFKKTVKSVYVGSDPE